MKLPALLPSLATALLALAASSPARAAERALVTVTNDSGAAMPAATVVIPFAQVKTVISGITFDQLVVKDAKGAVVPSQVTAFVHIHTGPQTYNDLIFQHDFAAGEKSATFTVEKLASPQPSYPSKVFARVVPERFDDFAWENDKLAHRAYGPGLMLPTALKDQMTSSGIDVWTKTVPWLVIEHWYHKGHDGLHTDTGEGLDMYDVNTNRGAGGTAIWDGTREHPSKNWSSWKVFANGPVRAVFELGYDAWDAGNGVMVTETKRVTVDAGINFDQFESTFTFTGPAELTVAVGLTEHPAAATVAPKQDDKTMAMSLWEEYKVAVDGKLGTGVILAPGSAFAGFANVPIGPATSAGPRPDLLALAKVKSGVPLRYYVGAGWDKAREFTTQAAWEKYVADFAARVAAPVKFTIAPAP